MLYPPSYFLSPSRGSTLLVLLESTLSDLFPNSDKFLPTDHPSNKDKVPYSHILPTRKMSNRTVQTTWKNNAVQISTMSTSRTVNQGNFAVLACYFTSWKIFILSKPILHVTACDRFCEVYLWYDTNEELVTCSSVSWAFGVLQSCLGLSLCV